VVHLVHVHVVEWVLEVLLVPPGFPFFIGSHIGDNSGSLAEVFHLHEESNGLLEVWAALELSGDSLTELLDLLLELFP
jgi:hypothetical protein